MPNNPFPANTYEKNAWDELQYAIDQIRGDYPKPVDDGPDPIDSKPGIKKRLAEALAQQIVLQKQYEEFLDQEELTLLEEKVKTWRQNNPRPKKIKND